jgi:hypothetical protein
MLYKIVDQVLSEQISRNNLAIGDLLANYSM